MRVRDAGHRVRGWHHRALNRRVPEGQLRLVGGGMLRVDPAARRAFSFFTMHEPEMVGELRRFLALTKSRRCLIDVGAHYGLFSLAFATRPGAVAHAVEPSEEAVRVLHRHASLNPELSVRVWPMALGNAEGGLAVDLGPDDHLIRSSGSGSLTVPVTSLDVLTSRDSIKPDTLKIDVEGMELEVLEGAQTTLRACRPLLFLEVHPELLTAAERDVNEVQAALVDAGYAIADLSGNTVVDLAAFCGGDVRRVVATPA